MSKQQVCGRCKEVVPGRLEDLRAHWANHHPAEAKDIKMWLGQKDDVLKSLEQIAEEGMRGFSESGGSK